ncbi:MAG: NADH-quinone oxidoreductase subunit N [Verrucomicrobia bacterium]|nr:NADH-quinone oxidoreductase subunit N [Verrucomicrobiota bacterium]
MIDLSLIRWELGVTALALALLLADLFLPGGGGRRLGQAAAVGLGALLILSLLLGSGLDGTTVRAQTANHLYTLDGLAMWAKQFFMFATLLTILMSLRFLNETEDHIPEHIVLQLVACLGMMLTASAADFLFLFISLELMAVSLYVLVCFRRKEILCLEAGLKYLIYGALSSGVMLYGIALVYGITGATRFDKVAQYAATNPDAHLLFLSLVLILVGLAFKISAAPFHWWTPDVYEGAPTPTVALLSIGSKGAGFVLLFRVLFEAFPACRERWWPLICAASGASILVGNLGAISQGNLKRLMGYSSISHSGYMLLGVAACSSISLWGLSAVLYYLLGYLLANALVFGVMCETAGENPRQDVRAYAGLGARSAWAAGALLLGLLSLAGIPPLAGFFGKLLVLCAAYERRLVLLLIVAIIGVVCSLYYYLGVIRVMYFPDAPTSQERPPLLNSTRWIFAALMILLIAVGFYQSPWWVASETAIRSFKP